MKIILTLTFLIVLQISSYSEEIFTSRKGSKFFPGHLEIVITVDSNNVRYELFNHWSSLSYAELRQITIPIDSLKEFNLKNDSIQIVILNGKVKLIDKKYQLSEKIKHKKLCASAPTMRKISFAYKLSSEHSNIKHYELYDNEDLKLDEEAFKKKVLERLKEKTK
ncbi:MAG TPA: hypothetical protein VGF79_02985 [Bacteroidia bacterium]